MDALEDMVIPSADRHYETIVEAMGPRRPTFERTA